MMRHVIRRTAHNRKLNNNFLASFTYLHDNSNRNKYNGESHNFFNKATYKLVLVGSVSAFLTYKAYDYSKQKVACTEGATLKKEKGDVGIFKDGLPCFTMNEVSKHTTKENGIWVTYKEGVYDITQFIIEHPGGEQILLAAGSSVEPFWVLYAVHYNSHVLQMLEKLRIGNLSKEDADFLGNMSDPYATDPKRHPVLKPASVKPFNAEPPPSLLAEQFITPNDLFYVRNHLPVPQIDPETYELEIEIEGKNETLTFSFEDLKKLPQHTITATIMCAGNRRSDMTKVKPVKGLSWGPAAVGNAVWTGVRLRDLLLIAGVDENDKKFTHVQFEAYDFDPTGNSYGASIPFWKAIDKRGDVILAYEMNGTPIPRDHGFPIRVIVPGVVGARNVKWLKRIVLSNKESDSHWQQNDYKGFSPCVDWENVDYSKAPSIQELPVISAICTPLPDEVVKVEDGHILVKGYAWSGGGQKIIRVDVTVDDGDTWHVANIDSQDSAEPPQHWSWTLWSARIPVKPDLERVEICAKAVDSYYNTQPESFKNIWNLRGVLSNAYHRVYVKLSR